MKSDVNGIPLGDSSRFQFLRLEASWQHLELADTFARARQWVLVRDSRSRAKKKGVAEAEAELKGREKRSTPLPKVILNVHVGLLAMINAAPLSATSAFCATNSFFSPSPLLILHHLLILLLFLFLEQYFKPAPCKKGGRKMKRKINFMQRSPRCKWENFALYDATFEPMRWGYYYTPWQRWRLVRACSAWWQKLISHKDTATGEGI